MFDDLAVQLTLEQAVEYLSRIRLDEESEQLRKSLVDRQTTGSFDLSVEFLDRLAYAHQLAVPFENLEIFDLHNPILLGTEALFDKIVRRRRGGYCFENNKMFNLLLKALGYQTTAHLGCVRAVGGMRPPLHRITLVYFDSDDGPMRRYVDVGMGGAQPASSLPLEPGTHFDQLGMEFSFTYGEADEASGITNQTWFLKRVSSSGELVGVSSFEEFSQLEVNFFAPNYYTSTHPNSPFTQARVVNIRRPDGFAAIGGDTFRLNKDGAETEVDVSDSVVRAEVLHEYFGIVLEP